MAGQQVTLALILLPFTALLFWATNILAPLLCVGLVLTYHLWRKYAR